MTATAEKLKLIQDTIGRMTDAEIIAGVHDWRVSARPEQLAPEGDWWTWLFLAGRGAGEHVSAFGAKRTCHFALQMSAYDPKRTLGLTSA